MTHARSLSLILASLSLAGLALAAGPGVVTSAQADGVTPVRKAARVAKMPGTRPVLVAVRMPRGPVPAEAREAPYGGHPARCDDPGVLSAIQSRFARKEANYWNSPLEIVTFDRIRESALRPWSISHIPRRYCEARVLTNDMRTRSASYVIGEKLGFAGYGGGIEFCVAGTDRNFAYAPDCKMARP